MKNSQVADQTLKGVILGAVAYLLVKFNVNAEAQAGVITGVTAALAYLSTKVGDKKVASFLSKAVVELPKIVEEVTAKVEEVEKKAPVKKKAPAKKAAAKSSK